MSELSVREFVAPESDLDLAYLAGLFDGEGSITRRTDGRWRIRIQMTDKEVIDWLPQFGGKVYSEQRLPPRKRSWTWEINRKRCVPALLETILPLLKVQSKIDCAVEALASYQIEPALLPSTGTAPKDIANEEEVGAFGVVTVVETRTCPMCEGSGRVPDVE